MSNSYTQVFGGTTIYPSDVSYLALALDANITLQWPLEANGGNNLVASIIDVTPSDIYTITMPNAMLTGVGQTVLFNNLGPSIVTVVDYDGNGILSMDAGTQWQIYLYNNGTEAGLWRAFRYGAATAQAQASALAGPGIIALGSVLAQASTVISINTTPYSLGSTDRANTYIWTGGVGTLNLPDAASMGNGWFFNVRNDGVGDLTISPAGSDLINGALTLVLAPADSCVVACNGTSWYTIGLGQQAVFAFDYTAISLNGVGNSMTVTNYTLTGSELNRIAYKFTGTVAGDIDVIVPATVQQYWINNATTGGSYVLRVRVTGSSLPFTVTRGVNVILYSDGTNIVQAVNVAGISTPISIANGGTGATSAASALSNLGGTVVGRAVFTAIDEAAGRTALLAAGSGANSDITSLTGLTTPLSVAQGGTGSGTAAGARTNLSAAQSGANTDISAFNYASGVIAGAPTGGAKGLGTINATGLFINGSAVGTGSGSVTSVTGSGGTTGLTLSGGPITTSGTLTLGGTLAVANGGTGQTTYTNGQLLIGNTTGNTLAKATLTAGSGITITNGAGSITIAATSSGGTVTSVSGSGGTTGLTLTGGPITGSGTLTLGGTLAVANGGTGAATAAGARTNLGLGTMATQAASAVAITGGSLASVTMDSDIAFTSSYSPTSVRSIGYRGVPQIGGAAKTANYTLALADAAGHVYFTGSTAAQTITIPANATVAYPIGTVISIVNDSSVTLSVAITSDTMKLAGSTSTGTRTLAVGAVATAIKVAATTWYISGAGVS